MALFILCKLILQMRMRSHPVGLDVVGPFVDFHTSCVRTGKALARLRKCTGSLEPLLVAYVISAIISWAGSFDDHLGIIFYNSPYKTSGERGGSVVECRTPEREVRGSRPTAAVLCPWARHFTPRKYWLITQEAMAPSRYDWKIVDWDVKPQHNQPYKTYVMDIPYNGHTLYK